MLNYLLSYMTYKQGEKTGKEAGISGLLIALVIFISLWKWEEWIEPLLNFTGVTYLFYNIGLIDPDFLGQTMINIIAFLIFIPILLLIPVIFVLLLIPILGNNVSMTIISIILAIVRMPLFIVFLVVLHLLNYVVAVLDLMITMAIRPKHYKENWNGFKKTATRKFSFLKGSSDEKAL